MIDRFTLVDDLPGIFRVEIDALIEKLQESGEDFNYVTYLEGWQGKFENELRRKVGEIAILNREVRENMKFIVTLREKAFQFELVQRVYSYIYGIVRGRIQGRSL